VAVGRLDAEAIARLAQGREPIPPSGTSRERHVRPASRGRRRRERNFWRPVALSATGIIAIADSRTLIDLFELCQTPSRAREGASRWSTMETHKANRRAETQSNP